MIVSTGHPDWRDVTAYAYTKDLTREGWAWEFLRRNPAFRKDLASRSGEGGRHKGSEEVPTRRDLKRWGIIFCGLCGSRRTCRSRDVGSRR